MLETIIKSIEDYSKKEQKAVEEFNEKLALVYYNQIKKLKELAKEKYGVIVI